MPLPSEPFSVPDPLADAWDEMVRQNRVLQARNQAFGEADQQGAWDPQAQGSGDPLNNPDLPMADWQALRAQRLAAASGKVGAASDAESLDGESGVDIMQGGAGRDHLPAPQRPTTESHLGPAATSHDDTSFWQLGMEWLTGLGRRHHEFGQNDPATQILRRHDHIQRVRDEISASPPPIGQAQNGNYDLGGIEGIPEFLKDYSAIPSGGAAGNLAAAYLGSYPLTYTVRNIDQDGVATVDFDAINTSSLASAMHIPILGYLHSMKRHVDPVINGLVNSGPGSQTTQRFRWTERIPTRASVRRTK